MAEAETKQAKTGLASRVKKVGKRDTEVTTKPIYPKQPAGTYEVIFGRVQFGYEDGEPVFATPGAHVELTSEEAARMVAEGTVKKVS